jgi:hypothetical protein
VTVNEAVDWDDGAPTVEIEEGIRPHESRSAVDQLLVHPNWHQLGPMRKEIAMLLALNEYDPESGVFSSASNKELARKYPGYTPDQFKHTFAALRNRGIASPRERFVDCSFGRRQIGTEYRLSAGTTPFRDAKRVERQRRAAKARRLRKDAGVLGKVTFSKADDREVEKLVRNRQR